MKREILLTTLIYMISMSILFWTVYHFFKWQQLSDSMVFVVGGSLFVAALGWGYLLFSLITAPKKHMEVTIQRLVDDIIHELNIPLATIKANSSMLKKSLKEDEKSLKRIQRIEDAGKRLDRLYKELSYTIQKEMKEIQKEHFELSAVIKERVAFFQEQNRNRFILELQEGVSVYADKIGFEQMLDNLINNAMKYSPKDKDIKITQNMEYISIKDEGIGMESTDLLRILERYYQADRAQEGKGLGLAIVKAYCDNENIQLQIKSEKNVGTEVILNIHTLTSP